MTALTLHSIDSNGRFSPTAEDMAKLIAFLTDDAAVIAAINEDAADDRPAVDEAPFVDGFSMPGYEYLGTRCIVSGGECLELDSKEGTDTDIPF